LVVVLKEFKNGFFSDKLTLPEELKEATINKNWGQVDAICERLIVPTGLLFQYLSPYAGQKRIEFIISIRDSKNEWEEDGIWHDDGSRILAFSMGLNLNPDSIEGGQLLLRKKGEQEYSSIPPMEFGEIIVFKTGISNYEHMVKAVTKGHRIVMAGWCYDQ
tara:strand:+ start:124301 stop:124783 length:483 start_codon:yes stop_codon:yes gene_type:complete